MPDEKENKEGGRDLQWMRRRRRKKRRKPWWRQQGRRRAKCRSLSWWGWCRNPTRVVGSQEEDRGGEFRARRWKLTWGRKKKREGGFKMIYYWAVVKWFNKNESWFKIRGLAWFSSDLISRRPFTSYLVEPIGFTWRFLIQFLLCYIKTNI